MEKIKEIKDAVQAKLIEMLAEDITKHEAFTKLKKELTSELLQLEPEAPKTRQLNSIDGYEPVNEAEERYKRDFGFLYNHAAVEERFKKIKKEVKPGEPFPAASKVDKLFDSTPTQYKSNHNKVENIEKIISGEVFNEMQKFVNKSKPLGQNLNFDNISKNNKIGSEFDVLNEMFEISSNNLPTSIFGDLTTQLSTELSKIEIPIPSNNTLESKLTNDEMEKGVKEPVKQTRNNFSPKKRKTKVVYKKTEKTRVTAASKAHKKK